MAIQAKNYLDFAGLSTYDTAIKAWSNTANQLGFKTVLKSADGNKLLFFKKPSATLTDDADAEIALGNADADTKLTALGTLVGATYNTETKTWSFTSLDDDFDATTVVGALNELLGDIQAVAADIAAMDGSATIATQSGNVVTIRAGVAQADGVISQGQGTDIVLEDVAVTGAAADVSVADTAGKITATNVEDALEELVDAIADAVDDSKVTCEENAGSGDVLKTYSFYQGLATGDDDAAKAGKKIVDINIPKDYVVRNAEVKTCTVKDQPVSGLEVGDKYIDLTINTKDGSGTGTATHLYIPFKELMDAVKGSTGAEVTVSVSADNTISATINKIASSKIVYKAGTGGAADVTVENALDTINGDNTTTGSIAKAQKDAIDTVVGSSSDAKTADTVNGAKAYADDAVSTAVGGLNGSASIATFTAGTSGAADVITIKGGITEADGVVGQNTTADDITLSTITASQINGLFA